MVSAVSKIEKMRWIIIEQWCSTQGSPEEFITFSKEAYFWKQVFRVRCKLNQQLKYHSSRLVIGIVNCGLLEKLMSASLILSVNKWGWKHILHFAQLLCTWPITGEDHSPGFLREGCRFWRRRISRQGAFLQRNDGEVRRYKPSVLREEVLGR